MREKLSKNFFNIKIQKNFPKNKESTVKKEPGDETHFTVTTRLLFGII